MQTRVSEIARRLGHRFVGECLVCGGKPPRPRPIGTVPCGCACHPPEAFLRLAIRLSVPPYSALPEGFR